MATFTEQIAEFVQGWTTPSDTRQEREQRRVYELLGGEVGHQARLAEQAREQAQFEVAHQHERIAQERMMEQARRQVRTEGVAVTPEEYNRTSTQGLTLENLQAAYRRYVIGEFGGGPWLDDGTPVFKTKKQTVDTPKRKVVKLKSFNSMLAERKKHV